MVIIYASWKVNAADRDAYDAWFLEKVREAQKEPGAIRYQYLVDMERPGRAINFEVWEDQAALEKHLLAPGHIEVVRDNSGKWGSSDFEIDFWDDAQGHRHMDVPSSRNTVGIHGLGEGNAAEKELAERVSAQD
ncbi:hypothetical protein GCM10009836_44450 [Pseudonocardia ailaonensis]|uniref:ABM domain-containing protein n=1 Tax=Pseudonocardia ailaonensis TaxID=367279 RepID=A0ABN2N9P6_9PSEU